MSSSIHIGKVSSGSFLHNDRTQKVSYLIDDSSLNECSRSSSECLQEFQSLKLQASENYTKLTNQKMQKSTIFLKEAIVNLEEHHTLKDLEPIKERLESYGFKVLQMSIHRDEGFVNPDNQKQKNYHAHITMFNLDLQSGKSVKFGKNYRTELSELQTFVANTLQMERGKVSVKEHADELKVTVSKASKRLDTHDYKKAMKIKEEAQQQLTISQKQGLLKDITIVKSGYDFREMQAKITALETLTVEQKKELHKLNSQAKNTPELESKNSKIQELESKIEELQTKNQELREHKKALITSISGVLKREQKEELSKLEPLEQFKKAGELVKENILGFKNQAIDASKTVETQKTTIDTHKSEIVNLRADMRALNASLIQEQKQKQELEQILPDDKKSIFTPLKDRFMGFVRELKETISELKETIKFQSEEILSLKTQNSELVDLNLSLVQSSQERSKELYLLNFKQELQENYQTFAEVHSYAKDPEGYRQDRQSLQYVSECDAIVNAHYKKLLEENKINYPDITKEDIQKAEMGYQKQQQQELKQKQSQGYGYSR